MRNEPVTVRIFGSLRPYRDARGLPYLDTVEVPGSGLTGDELAERLELPVDKIEGMFVNHTVMPLTRLVRPGDRVAFVPYDTPGPHRVFLGLYDAGKEHEQELEAEAGSPSRD